MGSMDQFRHSQMVELARLGSFKASWSKFEPEIRKILGPTPQAEDIWDLGDHLGEIFRSNSSGRTQSGVSGGGTVWECLLAWYLNLVMVGTDAVAIRPKYGMIPETIVNSTAITLSSTRTNTESDLVVLSAPSLASGNSYDLKSLDGTIRSNPKSIDVTVLQCKTNWNDNAQIPMLWNLIYASAGSLKIPNVSVGEKGFSPLSYRSFGYGFVTVPTSRGPFKPKSLMVLRVSALSAGNYWGRPTENGVARSIKEFFTANFAGSFASAGSVASAIQRGILADDGATLERYLSLNFLKPVDD